LYERRYGVTEPAVLAQERLQAGTELSKFLIGMPLGW